ncbi:MAG TPA: ABC transporter ATP-binding protein [Clostridiales bacterium]|jgi:ABC-2 type transport system ATP-binding protein|nr:ABC transporter ATP-binding protein [Clostridiales bacterium]
MSLKTNQKPFFVPDNDNLQPVQDDIKTELEINFTKHKKGETVLSLKNLTKRYGKRVAVDDVSLDVYSGEVFGFLGPNGAGKTTTIRMIAGLASITQGEAFICGHSIKKDFKQAVSLIGGIIENPEMYKHMTGWQNLKYYASLYGNISDEQIMNVVRLVKMENRIHEKVKRYSLGMRQRIGIAQSLLHSPRLLILDEPTNGLDPAGIHEMRDFLKMLAHEYGIAIFISSHILTEMQLMCDRVAIIYKGKLIAIKTVEEWTRPQNNILKIKLSVSPLQKNKAIKVLNSAFGCDIQTNQNLIVFSLPEEQLPKVSLELAAREIGIVSMSLGEKSLEETFLELTSASGTEIS